MRYVPHYPLRLTQLTRFSSRLSSLALAGRAGVRVSLSDNRASVRIVKSIPCEGALLSWSRGSTRGSCWRIRSEPRSSESGSRGTTRCICPLEKLVRLLHLKVLCHALPEVGLTQVIIAGVDTLTADKGQAGRVRLEGNQMCIGITKLGHLRAVDSLRVGNNPSQCTALVDVIVWVVVQKPLQSTFPHFRRAWKRRQRRPSACTGSAKQVSQNADEAILSNAGCPRHYFAKYLLPAFSST
jgi:hypothetical protein